VVAATDVALGGDSVGNRTAGSAFPWRDQTSKTLQNALPAVDCQRRDLQVDKGRLRQEPCQVDVDRAAIVGQLAPVVLASQV
jgi:hypothetical protein